MKLTKQEFEELYVIIDINIRKIHIACERKLWGKSWTEEDRKKSYERLGFLKDLKEKFDVYKKHEF